MERTKRIKLQLIKEQSHIQAGKGGVWCCVSDTVTLFLSVLSQKDEVALL